ncbi:MAG: HAD family hydrolase [Candidatus Micrarchaeia archaeon]|jgi:putative hydrolase of the HAD superfamily
MPLSPKVISFDLDGTLVDMDFDLYLWFEELPRLYSIQHSVSLDEAKRIMRAEYDAVGFQKREWYDLCFWIDHHKLCVNPRDVVKDLKQKITVFPDVIPALSKLKSQNRRMVVFSNTPKMFLDIKKKVDGLEGFFERTISVYSDYEKIKSNEGVFVRLASELGVKPCEILHVGDSYRLDYEPALREGCDALFLERRPGVSFDTPPANERIKKIKTLGEIEKYLSD